MRFSPRLQINLTRHLVRQRLAGNRRPPLVLMIEPTHQCNLSCAGCGRIREYRHTLRQMMSVQECLDAVRECGAPIVTVTGGEPLLHPDIGRIVAEIVETKRDVFLCTNGTLLAKSLKLFRPSPRLNINIHLDGLSGTHDAIAGKPGVFEAAVESLCAAKRAGFRVCSNTTIYKTTDVREIGELLDLLKRLRVDGKLLSPGFAFEENEHDVFLTRQDIHRKFQQVSALMKGHRIMNTPLYLEFLRGERQMPCTPWGNPTRNPQGWRSPCYLITDAHYRTYRELMERTDWERYRSGRDPRCQHCMVHCGYEPTVISQTGRSAVALLRMARWALG